MALEKRKIKAKKMVRHIRSGMSASELMERHSLTARQLREVLQRLAEAGWITRMEQFRVASLSESAVMQAFDATTEILGQVHKSAACEGAEQSNPSACVEPTEVFEVDEPTLRTILEGLRESTQIIDPKTSPDKPSHG